LGGSSGSCEGGIPWSELNDSRSKGATLRRSVCILLGDGGSSGREEFRTEVRLCVLKVFSLGHNFVVVFIDAGVSAVFMVKFGVERGWAWNDLVVSIIVVLSLVALRYFSLRLEQLILLRCIVLRVMVILRSAPKEVVSSFIKAGVRVLGLFEGGEPVGQWVDFLVEVGHNGLEESSAVGSSRHGWGGKLRWGIGSGQQG
jgi:hypothetical protein